MIRRHDCFLFFPQLYPPILITAYSEDRRVPLSGVMKYVERLKKAIQMCTTGVDVKGECINVLLSLFNQLYNSLKQL